MRLHTRSGGPAPGIRLAVLALAWSTLLAACGDPPAAVSPSSTPATTADTTSTSAAPPSTATPVAATTAGPPTGSLPEQWARVPDQPALGGGGRVVLSDVAPWDGGFVAVGSDVDDATGGGSGVILTSPDGVDWTLSAGYPGISFAAVAAGETALAATGLATGDEGAPPAAVVVTSTDGATWSAPRELPAGESTGTFVQTAAIAAWDGGFVAGGSEVEIGSGAAPWRSRPALWTSTDGTEWAMAAAFEWAAEATIEDVAADAGGVVAVGLVGDVAGTTHPAAWTSADGRAWNAATVEVSPLSGFSGMLSVARGPNGLVAVGFEPGTQGSVGAAWTSVDGLSWARAPEGSVPDDPRASTRIHAVAATPGGFVAAGWGLVRPSMHHVLWTSADGTEWRRFDLTDPEGPGRDTAAYGVAARGDVVVVVGTGGSGDGGAVWVAPPPPGLTPSVPIEPEPSIEAAVVSVTVDPARAVGATRVWVRGPLPEGRDDAGPLSVALEGAGGTAVPLCDARVLAARFECRVRLDDAAPGLEPGTYTVTVSGTPVAGATLDVLPEGSTVVALSAVYSPTLWPLVQSIGVRNHGAGDLDLSGWVLRDERDAGGGFAFPAGTIVPPGRSMTIDFGGPGGGRCPPSTGGYVHWCSIAGDGRTIDVGDGDHLWKGGDLVLLDAAGEQQAAWSPR